MAEFFQDENEVKPADRSLFVACPLCLIKRDVLTCDSCVRNGDFSHSKGKYSERYAEKLKKLENLKKLKTEYQERVLDVIRRREEIERLNCDVTLSRQRVSLLRIVVEEASDELKTDTHAINTLEDSNNKVQSGMMGHMDTIQSKFKQNQQCQANITKSRKELDRVTDELCEVRRKSIARIQKYLFPIQVSPVFQVLGTPPSKDTIEITKDVECDVESEHDDESRESELAEATRTSYIEGRWVSEEEEMRMEYSLNDAYLPANGNYSAYNDWVKSHRNGSRGPGTTSDEELPARNPAFMMTAALTHACQMVELMAFFLDVNLPKRISYSEFCHYELSRKEFQSAVDRLNTNVLHLCFTQHVEPSLLHPRRTLHNLYTCLNSLHLGRGGPFECYPKLLSAIDDTNDSDSDARTDIASSSESWSSDSDAEWENLATNLLDMPEVSTDQDASLQTSTSGDIRQSSEPATAASLVSSAAASVAALWPWKK